MLAARTASWPTKDTMKSTTQTVVTMRVLAFEQGVVGQGSTGMQVRIVVYVSWHYECFTLVSYRVPHLPSAGARELRSPSLTRLKQSRDGRSPIGHRTTSSI